MTACHTKTVRSQPDDFPKRLTSFPETCQAFDLHVIACLNRPILRYNQKHRIVSSPILVLLIMEALTENQVVLNSARTGSQADFARLAEPHRRELQVHCYRMLGSLQDAEDLVQETLVRAWQKLDTFEGRASFRAWLYKIATNACLDALDRRPKRTLPPLSHPPSDPAAPPAPPVLEPIWLEPIPDELLDDASNTPEARYDARESITLAFLTALQVLPPRQRAVLILCDVLDWHAEEAGEALGLTVSSVNSALHRARVSLAKHYRGHDMESIRAEPSDDKTRALLEQYVRAWQEADIDGLIALLKEEAKFPMPPSPTWYQGKAAIRKFVMDKILAGDARGRFRLLPTRANGQPAVAWYRRDETTGAYQAFGVQVLTYDGDLLSDITTFPNPGLFRFFGLPLQVKA
jgi:RNA polymerase sigma-70 factor, ECF subfamily